jgi:glycolate oxidase iron-sulfur subunit
MQTNLAPEFRGTPEGTEAEAILRQCVHCGFCTATCPTYQLLGDELDGPRGRIYLIKQVLEGEAPTRSTQLHLDRCLTCRNCESTCPSGVDYGHLVEIGRELVEQRVPRPPAERAARWLLKEGMTSPLFKPAVALGQALRPLLPQALKDKLPARGPALPPRPVARHERKVLLLAGCVQPALMPQIQRATERVLDAAGVQSLLAPEAGCCGAVRLHLNDRDGALQQMRRNIDAWWPLVEAGTVEAIVMNASGCGATVRDYGHALAQDPAYAAKAARISGLTRDLSELLPSLLPVLKDKLRPEAQRPTLVFQSPCTLQHGQQLRGGVESGLAELGFELRVPAESHLCCGSAGTYSLLQAELSHQLRDRKLGHLQAQKAQVIVSANIGCIQQLQSGTDTPVRHWIELVADALPL